MALTKCKECGKELSSKAEACPHCGIKMVAPKSGCGTLIGVGVLGFIILVTYSSLFNSTKSPSSTPQAGGLSSSTPAAPRSKGEPLKPGAQWSYNQYPDDMGKGTSFTAQVLSANTVEFGFPYSGMQHASLTLRSHPRHGRDLIFRIEKGQILCHSYEQCDVLVRFDEGSAVTYKASGAADNSSDVIFITAYDQFAKRMVAAKRVRISVPIYQEGSPAFEFDVSGFTQAKYKPEKQ